MGSKVWLMFLLLALAIVAESTTIHEATWGLARVGHDETSSCIGGHCNVEDLTDELMDSETNRRQLAQKKKYISYAALSKNNAPCKRRGRSYYGCRGNTKVNPYNRGCTVATQCYRWTD